MPQLEKICNLAFIRSILQEGVDIDELIEDLIQKAYDAAKKVNSMEELEGESVQDGDLRILKECPMASLINLIKKESLVQTGKEELPGFYHEIVQRYFEQHPGETALLHPLCIIHQAMRDIIGCEKGCLTRQVACRSTSSGKVVIAQNGISSANLTEDQAREKIEGRACIYTKKIL
ncbi:MAG: hypothetical protein GXP32_06610 [Kiritimatiellaeota bacterium]|nr:hypothetical protein [Kiritimatiellota bacterium]